MQKSAPNVTYLSAPTKATIPMIGSAPNKIVNVVSHLPYGSKRSGGRGVAFVIWEIITGPEVVGVGLKFAVSLGKASGLKA